MKVSERPEESFSLGHLMITCITLMPSPECWTFSRCSRRLVWSTQISQKLMRMALRLVTFECRILLSCRLQMLWGHVFFTVAACSRGSGGMMKGYFFRRIMIIGCEHRPISDWPAFLRICTCTGCTADP